MTCSHGRVYTMCGPASDETCHSAGAVAVSSESAFCVEGCSCPPGSVLHDGKCIRRSSCPCTLHNQLHQPGAQVPNDCNTW